MAGTQVAAGDAEAALAHDRTVLAGDPAHATAHFGLGNALAATRRFADAIAAYEAALRLAPADANLHYKLGNALIDPHRVASCVAHSPDYGDTQRRLAPVRGLLGR